MNRLVRPLTRPVGLALVIAALVALTAASCSYVTPPVMTMAVDGTQQPFFTMTWDDLQKELDTSSAATGATSTTSPTYQSATSIATILSQKVQSEALKQILDERKTQPNDADQAKAKASGGQQATDAAITQQAQLYALQRSLAEDAFASGEVDKERAVAQYFEQNKATYATPEQVCLHGIFVLPNQTGQPATDAEMSAALAKGKELQTRVATEPFGTVADEVNPAGASQEYPGGDLKCITKANGGFDDAQWTTLTTAAPGTVVDPMDLQGSIVLLLRVDSYQPAHEATVDEVRTQVETDVAYAIGTQLQGPFIASVAGKYVVVVDPHYGVWDPTAFIVNPPTGASQPTVPTTTTTTAPSVLIPTTTTTSPDAPASPPATSSTGSVPGTEP